MFARLNIHAHQKVGARFWANCRIPIPNSKVNVRCQTAFFFKGPSCRSKRRTRNRDQLFALQNRAGCVGETYRSQIMGRHVHPQFIDRVLADSSKKIGRPYCFWFRHSIAMFRQLRKNSSIIIGRRRPRIILASRSERNVRPLTNKVSRSRLRRALGWWQQKSRRSHVEKPTAFSSTPSFVKLFVQIQKLGIVTSRDDERRKKVRVVQEPMCCV